MGVVVGEVPDERLDLDEGTLEWGPHRAGAGVRLTEPRWVPLGRTVDVGRGFDHYMAHRRTRTSGRRQQVEGSDDVDLVKYGARYTDGVGLEEGVHDGVDLGGLHDAAENGVLLVGADELRAVEGYFRVADPEPEDHLHIGSPLESLSHPAAPECVEPGDENASWHRSDPRPSIRTRRCVAHAACPRAPPGACHGWPPPRPSRGSSNSGPSPARRRRRRDRGLGTSSSPGSTRHSPAGP